MARFYGEIGYTDSQETAPSVWEDVITERKLYGDVLRNTRQLREGDSVNDEITVGNSISVVADAYFIAHFFNIRYIRWNGINWVASSIEVRPPRLIIELGGEYHGPTPRP